MNDDPLDDHPLDAWLLVGALAEEAGEALEVEAWCSRDEKRRGMVVTCARTGGKTHVYVEEDGRMLTPPLLSRVPGMIRQIYRGERVG